VAGTVDGGLTTTMAAVGDGQCRQEGGGTTPKTGQNRGGENRATSGKEEQASASLAATAASR